MKVTVYIDGNHNTVEVKDKIKSVLPDANYMIFDADGNKDNKTNFDRIKKMSVQEMAELIHRADNFARIPHKAICERCCAYTKNGKCNKYRGDGKGSCVDGIKQWLESESEEE